MKPPANRQTHSDYISRINSVFDYIEENLDKDLSLDELASVSNFSKFHFHRIFWAMAGETPFEFIKRLRLEKASTLLRIHPDDTVSEIAIKCGFNNLSVFSRNFKALFGTSPTGWRNKKTLRNRNFSKTNSNHSKTFEKSPAYLGSEFNSNHNMEQLLYAEIRDLPQTTVAYLRHTGPYQGDHQLYNRLFSRLFSWAEPRGFMDQRSVKPIVIYHDDPCVTAGEKLRMSVCITVPPDTTITGEFGKMKLRAGRFLVAGFLLAPQDFPLAWKWIYGTWFPSSGYLPDDALPYEVYPQPPKGGKLSVEICIPLKPM